MDTTNNRLLLILLEYAIGESGERSASEFLVGAGTKPLFVCEFGFGNELIRTPPALDMARRRSVRPGWTFGDIQTSNAAEGHCISPSANMVATILVFLSSQVSVQLSSTVSCVALLQPFFTAMYADSLFVEHDQERA